MGLEEKFGDTLGLPYLESNMMVPQTVSLVYYSAYNACSNRACSACSARAYNACSNRACSACSVRAYNACYNRACSACSARAYNASACNARAQLSSVDF